MYYVLHNMSSTYIHVHYDMYVCTVLLLLLLLLLLFIIIIIIIFFQFLTNRCE